MADASRHAGVRHIGLILNGKAATDDALRAAVAALRAEGVRVDVRVTWEHGDAARHVDEAVAAGVDAVVAGGGDGTLREVAAALAMREDPAEDLPALAVLPLGTANDFATAAGIPVATPAEPAPAFALLRTSPRRVDALSVDADGVRHWCMNLASGGFGTVITTETNESLKKTLGGLAYVISGLAHVRSIEPIRARFEAEDFAWSGEFIALGVGNGRQAGGGQVLCPDARIDDGRLDITIVPTLEGEVAATLGTVIAEGRQAALERVSTRLQSAWVEIVAARPLTLNLDGEPVEATVFRIACVPGRLRMHLPDGCPLLSPGA